MKVLILGAVFLAVCSGTVIRKVSHADYAPSVASDTTPCSTNATNAWLDVIFLIDTSTAQTSQNLNKIRTLVPIIFSKFTIGSNSDITSAFNTRVAIVTYDYEGTIFRQFSQINSINDVTSSLNSIKISNSPYADLYDPIVKILKWQSNDQDGPGAGGRPLVLVFFAASANAPVNSQVPDLVSENFDPYSTTPITVNFNTNDGNLTSLLTDLTLNQFVNAPMYNFNASSSTLAKDLDWALLQANCFCGDNTGIPLILYDSTNKSYSRYRECLILDEAQSYVEDASTICKGDGFVIPAYILSDAKQKYIQSVWNDCEGESCYPFYVGLHKNAQGSWVWYDTDYSEFSSSYTNWGQGYPNNDAISNCSFVNSNDGVNFIWQNSPCNTQYSLVVNILCQNYICDAVTTDCLSSDYSYDDAAEFGLKKTKKVQKKGLQRGWTKVKKSQKSMKQRIVEKKARIAKIR